MGIKSDQFTELALKKRNIVKLDGKLIDLNQQSNQLSQQSNQLSQQFNQLSQQSNQLSQERNQLSQERNQLSQEKNQLSQEKELTSSFNALFARIDTNLQLFIQNPNDKTLIANIRTDMIQLRKIRDEMVVLSQEKNQADVYAGFIKTAAKVEQMVALHKNLKM